MREDFEKYEYILNRAELDVERSIEILRERENSLECLRGCKKVETKDLFSGFLLDFKVKVGESYSTAIMGDGRSQSSMDDKKYSTAYFSVNNHFFTNTQKEIIKTYLVNEYNVKLVEFVR